MFTQKSPIASSGRVAVLAVAAMALTAFEPAAAQAGAKPDKVVSARSGTSDATDISAARRHYYRGGGGAAAAAAFAGIVGTGLAIAASQDRGYYYGGGPAYYGGSPYDAYGYYGAPPAYGYYGGPAYRGGYNESDYGGQPSPQW
jgi:hypothetical protein